MDGAFFSNLVAPRNDKHDMLNWKKTLIDNLMREKLNFIATMIEMQQHTWR